MTKVSDFSEQGLVFKEKPTNKKFQDLGGQKFGRLTVVGFLGDKKWCCKCDCGNYKSVNASKLKSGRTRSCGCFKIQSTRERRSTHRHTAGRVVSRIYSIWNNMKRRCYNPKSPNYSYYGGRGITVCDSWHVFENFLADMGEPPSGMTLERIENNVGYCRENCRWATKSEQANNRRSNRILEFDGKSQTMAQWAEETGIKWGTLYNRLRSGWPIERVLTK